MRQGFLRGSRYSPRNMDRESLEALFVGRGEVMDDVLSRVTVSIRSPEKHYVLLVGPRGSGKTHFLALAYHRLMDRVDTANASGSVAVALLKEEEWGVASFLDLVVRILRALADQAPHLDSEIAGIYDRFSKDPAGAEAFAIALLRQHTRGKTLLLLCENLVDLFDALGEEGQKRWRATIQEDGNWTIVASTPSLFAAVTLQDNPFYGFFTIRALEKIDFDTGVELLARKAAHEGKTELADFLRTPLGRARARAVHHLAAGNHRAYVVLFDFLDRESLEDLVGPFMRMVDDLTPYYQDRMRQLPPAQRKIVEFLCLQGRPTTIKDISTPCLMSHQTTAKQIGELRIAGFVSRTRFGRNTFCELSEPLMRICIEAKDNKTQHFRLFVEFLRHWFTTREVVRREAAFQHDVHTANLDRVHVEVDRALAIDADDQQARHLRGLVLFDMADYRRASEELQRVASQDPNSVSAHCRLSDSLLLSGKWEEAIDVSDRLLEIDPVHSHAHYVRGEALIELDRPADAIAAFDELLPTSDCRSLLIAAASVREIGDYASAGRYLDRVAELQPENRELWIERTRLHLDEGIFDVAAESAIRVEALPGCSLLGRLLAAQVAAATRPLPLALDALGATLEREDFESDEERHLETTKGILTVSVRNFGPRYLPEGLAKLRDLLADQLDRGIVGRILTDFLKENVDDGFAGSLPDWEIALESLAASLADLPDCRIPVEMLQVAVRYTKTGDKRHLLRLPLEQRQLLEDVLPRAPGEHAVRA